MKKIFLLLSFILLITSAANSGEKEELPDNCYAEYKVSPKTFGCNLKKGFRKMLTKDDGSLNAIGKFYNSKSLADLKK